jgi:ubiquitin related modifier 1
MLFANERKHILTIPAKTSDGKQPTIAWLIQYLVENLMQDTRKELFILDDHV